MSAAVRLLPLLSPVLTLGAMTAQEPTGPRAVPAAALTSQRLVVGDSIVVEGKYRELVGTEVKLYDCDLPFRIEHGELTRKLRELQAQRDNITIRGTVISTGESNGRVAVRVDNLERAASDTDLFARALEQNAPRGLTAPELERLLRRITVSYQRFPDAALMPLFRSAFLRYAESAAAGSDGSMATAFAALRDMHASFDRKELTLELAKSLMRGAPEPPQLEPFLSSIGCRKYRGQWWTYEDFKRQEGFLEHEGRWVQPREKHLEQLLQRLNDSRQPLFIIRKRTDREYLHLAKKGSIEEGMKLEEVSLAIGFPDRVERRLFEQKELTQWSYGTTFCYFYDGLLLKLPDKP